MTNMPVSMPSNPLFTYEGHDIRLIIDADGNPWFVAKDVCDVLGITNNRDALAALDDDEKNTVGIADGTPGNPNKAIINEPGLYSLVLRSRKPEAKAFKRWITHEVIPSIRKRGFYGIENLTRLEIGKMLVAAEEEKLVLAAKVAEYEPKVEGFNQFLNLDDSMNFREVANTMGMSSIRLCSILRANEILTKDRKTRGGFHNFPRQKYLDAGWFVRIERPDPDIGKVWGQTRVTPYGAEQIRQGIRSGRIVCE